MVRIIEQYLPSAVVDLIQNNCPFCDYKSRFNSMDGLVVKMEPLRITQNYLQFFGLCPPEKASNMDFMTSVKRFIIVWICYVMSLIPTSYFLYSHLDNPDTLVSCLVPITGFIFVSVSYITLSVEGVRAVHAFTYLRSFVMERKCKKFR